MGCSSSLPTNGDEWTEDPDTDGCHASDLGGEDCNCWRNLIWTVTGGWGFAVLNVLGGLMCCATIIAAPIGYEMVRSVPDVCCPFGKRWKTKPNNLVQCEEDGMRDLTNNNCSNFLGLLIWSSVWLVLAPSVFYFPVLFFLIPYFFSYLFLMCKCPACLEIVCFRQRECSLLTSKQTEAALARTYCSGDPNDDRIFFFGRRTTSKRRDPSSYSAHPSTKTSDIVIELPGLYR